MAVWPRIVCFFILWLLTNATVFACMCKPYDDSTPEKVSALLQGEVNRAEIIFAGEVIALDRLMVKFKVTTVWKGSKQDEITMSTRLRHSKNGRYTFTSCDYEFTKGQKYIVYAKSIEGILKTSQCTGTTPAENEKIRTAFLDKWQQQEKAKQQ